MTRLATSANVFPKCCKLRLLFRFAFVAARCAGAEAVTEIERHAAVCPGSGAEPSSFCFMLKVKAFSSILFSFLEWKKKINIWVFLCIESEWRVAFHCIFFPLNLIFSLIISSEIKMNTLPGSVKNIYIVELFTLPVNSEFCCKPRKKEKPLSAFAWQGKEKGACTGSASSKGRGQVLAAQQVARAG